jgi:hypothetical protein
MSAGRRFAQAARRSAVRPSLRVETAPAHRVVARRRAVRRTRATAVSAIAPGFVAMDKTVARRTSTARTTPSVTTARAFRLYARRSIRLADVLELSPRARHVHNARRSANRRGDSVARIPLDARQVAGRAEPASPASMACAVHQRILIFLPPRQRPPSEPSRGRSA